MKDSNLGKEINMKENAQQKASLKQTKLAFPKKVLPTFVKIVKDTDKEGSKDIKSTNKESELKITISKTINGYKSSKQDSNDTGKKSIKKVNAVDLTGDSSDIGNVVKENTKTIKLLKKKSIDADETPLSKLKKQISEMEEDLPLSKVKNMNQSKNKNNLTPKTVVITNIKAKTKSDSNRKKSLNHSPLITISGKERTPKKSSGHKSSLIQPGFLTPKQRKSQDNASASIALNVRQSPRLKKLAAEKKIQEEKIEREKREKDEKEALDLLKKKQQQKLEQVWKACEIFDHNFFSTINIYCMKHEPS